MTDATESPRSRAYDARMYRPSKLAAAALTALAVTATSVHAKEPSLSPGVQERAEEAIREATGKILGVLEMLIGTIPQYEMPEVLDNGDIIIRRKRPDSLLEKKQGPDGEDEAST